MSGKQPSVFVRPDPSEDGNWTVERWVLDIARLGNHLNFSRSAALADWTELHLERHPHCAIFRHAVAVCLVRDLRGGHPLTITERVLYKDLSDAELVELDELLSRTF